MSYLNVNDINMREYTKDYHVLTDELIKSKIASTAGSKLLSKIPILFIGGFVLAFISTFIEAQWLFMLVFLVMFMGVPGIVIYSLAYSNKVKKTLTLNDVNKAQLVLSEFVGTRRHHKSKGGTSYYALFLDDNGVQQREKINSMAYREFNQNLKSGDVVVLLKYPKYEEEGYGYHMMDAADFDNQSSIETPRELENFYNNRNDSYTEQPRSWNSNGYDNEDW